MQKSLIIGFGRAGRGLHYHCLRKAYQMGSATNLFDQNIGVVDPYMDQTKVKEDSIIFFRNIGKIIGFDPKNTVVHICTPPEIHSESIKQSAELGFTKFIIEKPLASSLEELNKIRKVKEKYNLDLLVVANWLSSSLTLKLVEILDNGVYGPLLRMVGEQNKARLTRTISNPSHGNAFDVEIPHLVALALRLGGSNVEVVQAKATDMNIGEYSFSYMGGASMTLSHQTGVTSELLSNLESPTRERCLRLYFKECTVIGYYPCSQDDSYSWLKMYSTEGQLLEEHVLFDDPLPSVFTEYYQYFETLTKKPISDLEFNTHVITTICQAKKHCGLMIEEADIEKEVIT